MKILSGENATFYCDAERRDDVFSTRKICDSLLKRSERKMAKGNVYAPGMRIVVRDEEWLVRAVETEGRDAERNEFCASSERRRLFATSSEFLSTRMKKESKFLIRSKRS